MAEYPRGKNPFGVFGKKKNVLPLGFRARN